MTAIASPHDWKEVRRFRALELKQDGWTQQEIAEGLGVTKGAVSQWMHTVKNEGMNALYASPHTGGPPKLSTAQHDQIPELLSQGAEAYHFRGEVWTCARIAKVIEWEFGVSYHPAHVSRILKALKWTPQKPLERAAQRDEQLIAHWRTEVWPELKKRRRKNGEYLSLLMKQVFTCCPPWCVPTRRVVKRPSLKCH